MVKVLTDDVWKQLQEKYGVSDGVVHAAKSAFEQQGAGIAPADEPLYLLRNLQAGFLGNSPLFWARSGGYTQWIDQAQRFTAAEAAEQMQNSPGKFEMYDTRQVERVAQCTVDIQHLKGRQGR